MQNSGDMIWFSKFIGIRSSICTKIPLFFFSGMHNLTLKDFRKFQYILVHSLNKEMNIAFIIFPTNFLVTIFGTYSCEKPEHHFQFFKKYHLHFKYIFYIWQKSQIEKNNIKSPKKENKQPLQL